MKAKRFFCLIALPPIPIAALAVVVGIAVPVTSLITLGPDSIITYVGYAFSFYALMVICFRIPNLINTVKRIKNGEGVIGKFCQDPVKRIHLSTATSLIFNVSYALFNLSIAVIYRSLWSLVVGAYYIPLTFLRLLIFRYVRRCGSAEQQLRLCRRVGVALLLMHSALTGLLFYILKRESGVNHGEIATIALAAFTFVATAVAIIGLAKYKKMRTPVYSMKKEIDLAAALVSMLMLENAMLGAFGDGSTYFNTIMLYLTGGAVATFMLGLAFYTVIGATLKLKRIRKSNE